MSKERIQHLAERVKAKSLPKTEDTELRRLRAKALAPRAPEFWGDFVRAVATAIGDFKHSMRDQPGWSDFDISADPSRAVISKMASPYIRANLELDIVGACIRGSFLYAKVRPGTGSLFETPIRIELRTDGKDQVFGVIDSHTCTTLGDLALQVLEKILDTQ